MVWTKDLIANPSAIKKILKPKIKSYRKEATDFHDKEIFKLGFNYIGLSVILISFAHKKERQYYQQVFLK